MSLWAEIPLLTVVILGMLTGFFGLLLVFFPGLTVIWRQSSFGALQLCSITAPAPGPLR